MSDQSLDQYLQQGMYGPRETKPDERRLFLGSLRERVIIALTKGQVLRPKAYREVIDALGSKADATLSKEPKSRQELRLRLFQMRMFDQLLLR